MKYVRSALFYLITLGFVSGFVGCGDDPKVIPSNKEGSNATTDGNQTSQSSSNQPNALPADGPGVVVDNQPQVLETPTPVKNPGPKWSGSPEAFMSVFGGRGMPNELPRLFVNATAAPYTGLINKVFPNGKPQFTGQYKDGYLDGDARWWNKDGSLASAGLMKEGKVVKWEIQAQAKIPVSENTPPAEPVFVGTNHDFGNWSTNANIGEGSYLLEKKTGERVNGAIKVHTASGRLITYKEYQDGKQHGLEVGWNDDGQKNMQTNYADGQKNGKETMWNENGVVIYEAFFVNGKQHGIEITRNDDGSISSENRYENGELVEQPE